MSIATIGNFDGLHHGHLALIHKLNATAGSQQKLLITFDRLPQEFLSNNPPLRLQLLRDKITVLQQTNLLDKIIVLRFNKYLAELPPLDFIKQKLHSLNINTIVAGSDFRFGYLAAGGIDDLRKAGIKVISVVPQLIQQQRISSTLMRQYAAQNDLSSLFAITGRNMTFSGHIVHGNKLARKFLVPTINFNLGRINPALRGVFISNTYIAGEKYSSISNIGCNPTISNMAEYKIETHLLGINLDLYGKIATVEILCYLRSEQKFATTEAMFAQIQQDLVQARHYHYC